MDVLFSCLSCRIEACYPSHGQIPFYELEVLPVTLAVLRVAETVGPGPPVRSTTSCLEVALEMLSAAAIEVTVVGTGALYLTRPNNTRVMFFEFPA